MTRGWTDDYFDTVYLRRWSLGPPGQEIHRNVEFLLGELAITKGQSLLDVACGQGRYSLAFASHGLQVIGLDASEVLLKEGRRLASKMGLKIRWIRGDMRSIPCSRAFDHSVLIDSFGFFDSEAENATVIGQLAGAVLPRGRIAIAVVTGGGSSRPLSHRRAKNVTASSRRSPGNSVRSRES
jgi:cyclopropane fatty-acyl-phospholipid synthase-like methyltransferase